MGVTSVTSENTGGGFRWCDGVCVKEEVADFVFIICRFTLKEKRCIHTIKIKKMSILYRNVYMECIYGYN